MWRVIASQLKTHGAKRDLTPPGLQMKFNYLVKVLKTPTHPQHGSLTGDLRARLSEYDSAVLQPPTFASRGEMERTVSYSDGEEECEEEDLSKRQDVDQYPTQVRNKKCKTRRASASRAVPWPSDGAQKSRASRVKQEREYSLGRSGSLDRAMAKFLEALMEKDVIQQQENRTVQMRILENQAATAEAILKQQELSTREWCARWTSLLSAQPMRSDDEGDNDSNCKW